MNHLKFLDMLNIRIRFFSFYWQAHICFTNLSFTLSSAISYLCFFDSQASYVKSSTVTKGRTMEVDVYMYMKWLEVIILNHHEDKINWTKIGSVGAFSSLALFNSISTFQISEKSKIEFTKILTTKCKHTSIVPNVESILWFENSV